MTLYQLLKELCGVCVCVCLQLSERPQDLTVPSMRTPHVVCVCVCGWTLATFEMGAHCSWYGSVCSVSNAMSVNVYETITLRMSSVQLEERM